MARTNLFRITPHRTSLCPSCGVTLSASTSVMGDHVPEPGDWTCCAGCGTVLRYDARLATVLPGLGEYEALAIEQPAEHYTLERIRRAIPRVWPREIKLRSQ